MSEENSIFDGVIVAAYTNKETAVNMLKKVEEAKKAIKDERYEEVGHALEADNSALIIVSDRDYLQNMQNYAGEDETAIAMHKLTDGIHEHMVQGNSVAYRITSAGRSVSCHRLRDSEILDLLELEAPED
ncbi:MAG: hypothetical protein P8169_03410 [Chloroflexota bacterium]